MITSEMDKWGVLIILTKNTIYLFYLWKLIITYSTYDISYTYVTYTWNAAAFGDSDDEDLNDAAEHDVQGEFCVRLCKVSFFLSILLILVISLIFLII